MNPQRKEKWEQMIPQVMEAGNCGFCKKELDNGYDSFWGNCGHFGKKLRTKNAHYRTISDEGSDSGHKRYLEMYRKDILKPLIDKYPVKLEQGVGQIMLFAHRHTILEINEKREEEKMTKVPDERVFAGIPIYPMEFDIGATRELFLHCMEVLALIQHRFGDEPLDIHVQMGSSQTAVGAITHALYSYFWVFDTPPPSWSVYDYNVDYNYNDEFIGTNQGSKFHIMTTNFITFRDYVAKNRLISQESAELKEKNTRLESELLKVTSLLSDHGSTLSAESVRINSLLEKNSEEK
jgi:hypothetical protein